jgi:hypothetical protein
VSGGATRLPPPPHAPPDTTALLGGLRLIVPYILLAHAVAAAVHAPACPIQALEPNLTRRARLPSGVACCGAPCTCSAALHLLRVRRAVRVHGWHLAACSGLRAHCRGSSSGLHGAWFPLEGHSMAPVLDLRGCLRLLLSPATCGRRLPPCTRAVGSSAAVGGLLGAHHCRDLAQWTAIVLCNYCSWPPRDAPRPRPSPNCMGRTGRGNSRLPWPAAELPRCYRPGRKAGLIGACPLVCPVV